jgi:RNA polymerase sigma factor (TIGR02999 family)
MRIRSGYASYPNASSSDADSWGRIEQARSHGCYRTGGLANREVLDALLPIVYKELRQLAHFQLRRERADHTPQSAALANEVYVRLIWLHPPRWESRKHFFVIPAQQMRQILVDYARRHRAGKRGGGEETISLEDTTMLSPRKN